MDRIGLLHRSDRGATFVEFAIVLPLLLALVLGIFTGGNAYARKIGIVEAVREGARYGASLTLGTGPTAVTQWESSVRNRVAQASGGELTAEQVCARLVLPSGASECGVADPPGTSPEPRVHVVKVLASKSAHIEFFFFTLRPTLESGLAARYERDTG